MNRRQLVWLAAMAVLTLLVAFSAPDFMAQEPPVDAVAEAEPDESAVEQILRQQEALITGQRFIYDPAGRRDPFRSLFETVRLSAGGKRPPGARGMLVAEINIVGIVRDENDGDMALVMGSDNKGYFLQVGEEVFDGTVIAVDPRLGTITFRQSIDDPRMIKPYRDVVKRLVPLQDEESSDE